MLRRFLRGAWKDVWMAPAMELIVGCIILVLSAAFWTSADQGAIWDMHQWRSTVGAILGPWFVYRAWIRRHDAG